MTWTFLKNWWQRFRERRQDPQYRQWRRHRRRWAIALFLLAHTLGALTSINALLTSRTPQGTIGWVVSLNTAPVIAVPLYWLFGVDRFEGYVQSRRERNAEISEDLEGLGDRYHEYFAVETNPGAGWAAERLARLPFLAGNSVELLINGEEAFSSMLEGIEGAERYVLAEFFTFNDDQIGRRFADALAEKARQGVDVYLLYDAVGSRSLGSELPDSLREAGVHVAVFPASRNWLQSQINFRNHRKIVVVDGKVGWTGGLNVGDAYLGRHPRLSPWRDTAVRLAGPAVAGLQVPFFEDWHWATEETLELDWTPPSSPRDDDAAVLVVPSGPADRVTTASLLHQQAIHLAEERLWLATPYFVPDRGVLDALHLAILRGVDVRLLVPSINDSQLVALTHPIYFQEMLDAGAEVWFYEPGFLHQKVWLVDDSVAGVGTVNLDNRSLRLNFEDTAVIADEAFAGEVARMLEDDFATSRRLSRDEFEDRSLWTRILNRGAYLLAPIQ